MKKIFVTALSLGTALTISACTKSSSNNTAAGSPGIPDKLAFQKPTPGAPLTKAQVQSIKDTFKVNQMMMLPPGDLVFPNKNRDPKEIAAAEDDLKKQDPNSYEMLTDIKNGCNKGSPSFTIDATFPLDGANGIQDLKTGDKVNEAISLGLDGSQCPVDLSYSASFLAQADSIDSASKSGSLSANASSKGNGIVLSSKYAQLLGARGLLIDSELSGLALLKDTTGKAEVNYNLSGTAMTLNVDVPYSMTIQALGQKASDDNETPASSEFVGHLQLSMPDFVAIVDLHSTGDSSGTEQHEVYINGNPMSDQDLKDLFGDNTPVMMMQKNSFAKDIQKLK